ncbi:glutathione peroxidase [Microvirga sp. STR05]|uniref:Glutathione peroxidase n=1 Tax=Hymenobacter duratus TaxID=2771356 RepID=A0ABR8JKR5_9BACT|nr:glutathione peroxidase [Hymenobacter duratus]MBD2715119.1 glutathione peroxidase [Hymenobacter duratus]MBR7950025.1 glutathione peroxidase [Microvirga sp. STR05]
MASFRQKLLKQLYPLIMRLSKSSNRGKVLESPKPVAAPAPFHELGSQLNTGSTLAFEELKGKKVLLVNTASNCGYTNQYQELQQLSEQYADQLVVLGFPANDFAEQEKDDDKTIEQFCQVNFGVSFPLMKKSVVVKQPQQNPVYQWLSDARRNGWNEQAPDWNFSKYLISEDGRLTHYFGPAVSPLSDTVTSQLKGR